MINMDEITVYRKEIRSLDYKKDGTLLIGTRGSELYEVRS